MLKKAKIAFLLVIALVFAVQGIGMDTALAAVERKVWTADEVIYANLLEGLGEAAATGLVAETYNQSSHSEANVIADKVIRRSDEPFLISGRANASMPFNLVVSVELPVYHLADTMTFGLYTKNGDDYTYTGISKTVDVEGKEEVKLDFGRITDDDLRFHELYVFQIENNDIVEEGTQNSDKMNVEYGPPATTGVDGVIYIGSMEYTLPQNGTPSSECKIFQAPDEYSTEQYQGTISKVEFGPNIKLYKKTENGYEQLPDSAGKVYENGVLVDSKEAMTALDKVYIRDDSWPTTFGDQGYLQLMYVTHDGSSYVLYGEHEITVSYKAAGKAKALLDDLANLSYNLANSKLGLGGTSIQGPGGTPLATGGSTVTGTVTDGKVVSLYTVPVENNVVQARKYLDAASQNDGNRQTGWTNHGLPIAANEYVVINVVVPAGTDYIDFTTDASNVSLYNGNGDTDLHGDWGNGEPLSFGRLIWNPVTWDGSAYVPYTGKVYVGGGGAGIYLAPNSTYMSNSNPAGTSGTTANACTLIAREVYQGGQEIHQTSFDTSSTYVRMRNTHPVTVEGSKTWNDEGHTDKRPESIEVTLYAAYYNERFMGYGTPQAIKTITVTAEDNWSWKFEGLPQFDDQEVPNYINTPGYYIQYTVDEKVIPSYAKATTPPGAIGDPEYDLNITNTYDETQIVVEGEKIWDDANNQDGKRPTSITVQLQARYKKASESNWSNWEKLSAPKYYELRDYYYNRIFNNVTDTLTVDEDDNWSWDFGGLKTKYWIWEGHGWEAELVETDWEYRVVETEFGGKKILEENKLAENGGGDIKYDAAPGQQVDTDYDVTYISGSYDIKNSYTPEKTEVSGTKVWVPATVNKTEVTVNLYIVNADGTETDTGLTAKANQANNWTWSFTDLAKYKDGVEIVYKVKENNVPQGFWSEVSEDGRTVYNIAKDVKLKGKKVWKDQNGAEMNPPNSASGGVQIEVYRQDDKLMATLEVGSWTGWAWSVELPGLMPDGITDAEYYVEEAFVPNYTSTPVEGEEGEEGHYKVLNWTVTNTHKPISIKVTKVWVDDENESGMRPTELKLYLKRRTDSSQNWQDATDSNHQPIVAVLDVANGQTEYTFTNLPEYDDNGNKYEYYVEELTSNHQPPVGYTPSYDTDTDDAGNIDYTLTNTINKVSISGTKTWSGLEASETHPTSVNLKVMYHNGTENVVHTTKTITGGERENSWNWTISDLPEYINGQKVTYTVEEEAVFGYDSSVSGDMTNGFAVTNTKKEVGRIRLYKESDSETEERKVGNETIVARKRLDGAVFRLYSDEACQNEVLTDHEKYPFTTASTGSEKGKLTIENVPYGTYWLKEVETPEGYTLYGDGVYKVVVNAATADVIGDAENEDYQGNNPVSNVVLNKKITGATGSIALTKTDADTGEKLSGAVFTVYSDEACTTSKGTMTVKDATNNPGVYTMENLPAGTYYVKETAPEGYRQPAADHKYTVTVQAGKVINVANGSEFVAASATPITNKAITSVSVEKVWDDSNNGANKRPASIQVQLYNGNTPVGNPVNLPITLEDNTQSWSYTWNDLDKYVAGTNNEIAYTVDEVSVPDHYIKTVTTNGNAVTITNKYVAETEVTLSAKKTLNGADYTGDEFTFVLAGNNVNETVSSVDSGVVTFPKITYTLADLKNADGTLEDSATFTYTISEEEGSAAGVTYDDTIYTAVVTLTYNAQTGELEHSVAYTKNAGAADEEGLAQDEVPVFANTSIELVSVSVTKEWKHGTNISTNWPAQIQVVLTVDGVADYNRMVRLPVNNNDWSYTWPDLPKYGIDEEGKQYEIDYSVMENSVPNDYVSKLSAKAKNDYVITNTYVEVDQELELTFPVTKMVKGGTTDELFTFKLEARPSAPPAPMPEGAVLGINGYNYITTQTTGTAAGTTVNFDTIKVTSAKVKEHGQNPPYYITYGWKISEVIPENKNPNIIYDEGWYEILVNFCINEDGKLAIGERDIWDEDWENILGQEPDVTITHYDAEGNYTQIPYNDGAFALPFTNTYFAPTQVNLAAQKTLNDAAYDGTAYSFQLKKGNNIVETVTEADNGAVAFTPIEFTLADMKNTDGTIAAEKTFTYTISEEAGSAAGVTYDNTVYTAEVTVTCKVDEGTLSSEVVYKKDGTAITGEVPVFANTAEKVNVSVTKVWDDNNDKAKKRPESIQVQLKKDGAAEGDPVTLPYNGSWNYTWPDLLKYEEGKTEPIEYTVEEITTDGNGNELPWVKDYIPGEPAGDMENGFTITNTYVSAETEITLTKKLDGQPSKTEFDFTLTPKTEGDKNKAASANNSAAGGIVFSLAYGKADMGQTYVYEIAETAKDGYYCDSTVYTVTVAVGDEINADGTLPLTVTYTKGDKVVEAADLVFENASAITAELPVQKTLTTNVADVERTYRFTLTPEGATEAEQTIDVSVGESQSSDDLTGSNKFELSFAAPGTYTYTVAEAVASELPGYTYDESVYTVTYEVEMANGKLQMAAGYPQITLNGTAADELAFTNDYKQEAGSATIHANKVFTNGTLTDGQFTFELEDKDGKVVTATNNANGVVTFPDLHFDAVGEYDYTLREKLPADAATGGIVYDGKSVAVKVKVVKDGNQLTATVEYNNTATVPTFTNEQLKTTIELTANKVFTNGTLTDGQFTFELLDEAGTTPIKDASGQPITATNEADGSIVFPELTYTAPGEYKYTIKEQIPENQGNIAYDKASFPVTVTVTRVGNELKAEATYPNGAAEFTNEQLSTTGKVYVKKNFADNKTAAGDYTFTMTPVGDAPALTTNTLTLTFGDTTTEASGVFQLPTYTAPGTYTYTVEESTATKNANVEYDSTKYTVVVTVERVNDELVATVTSGNKQITEQEPIVFTNKVLTTSLSGTKVWAKDKETDRPEKITIRLLANGKATGDICELASDKTEWSFTDLPVNDENGEIIYTVSEDAVPGYATSISGTTITNTKVADGQAVIQARKVLSGATLEEGQFTFQLLDAGGNVVDTKTNDANGLITFTAITYDMDDMKGEDGKKVAEKAFTYTIKEVIPTPEEEGYTYDETEHPVTVTVTEDTTDHKLNATVDYGTAGEVVFTNTYSETEAILSVTKELVHSSDLPKAATFTFTLKDGKDKVLGSKPLTFDAKSESVQTVDFDKITYKTAGTYTYTVTETPAEDTAITSDATVYQVTVDVKATENGLQQTTTIKADGKDASAIKFTNTYNATVDVTGTKKWVGDNAAERPESITLTLYADGTEQTDKTPVFTDTDKDTWQWSFTDLPKYNAAGDAIIYTVSEDEVPGYVTEISGTTITNTKVADGQAVIKAKKTLNGAAPAEGQFTFQLLKDGKVVDTKTNDATGMVTFKTLEYSDEAEETYTIVEVLPAGATAENNYTVNGMTYDPAQHTAKVKVVQDDASKKLVATVTYDGTSTEAPEFTNTYTVTGTTLALSLSKTLENSAKLPEDRTETFTFVLADAAGATKDEATVSFTNTSDATQTVAFDTLTFDAEGTYNYTITETASTKDDIITDTTKYSLEVKVEDVNGQLVATKTLTKQTGAEEATSAEAIAFTNTYDFDKFGELTLNVTKAMSGRAFQSGDSFTFTVTGDNGAPMPEKTTVTIEPTSGTTAAVDFGKISYTEADVGKTYTYTIQETEPAEADKLPGVTYDTTEYTVTVKVTEGADALVVTPTYAKDGKVTITNTYENELTEIAVKKVWVETDPEQQAQRPASVDVQLYAGDVAVTGKVLTLNAANLWAGRFTDLPKYVTGTATPIAYTVKEITEGVTWTANYTTGEAEGSMTNGFTITNTNKHVATTEIAVTKVWVEANDEQQALRPTSVDVQLYADGVAVTGKVLTLTATDGWTGSFANLQKYVAGTATPINYTVKEVTDADWLTNYTPGEPVRTANGYTITNTSKHVAKTEIEVTKVWVEANDEQQAQRPASIQVQLYADNVAVTDQVLTLNEGNAWAGSFTDLVKYQSDNETLIAYTVKEITGDWTANYTTAAPAGDMATGYTITNTSKYVATTEIAVTKAWVETNAAQQALRPTSVDVQLYADGVAMADQVLTLTAADAWKGSFTDLVKYQSDNVTPIQYTVKEITEGASWLAYYTPGAPSGDMANGFTITNTSNYNANGKLLLTGTKTVTGDSTVAEHTFTFGVFDQSGKEVATGTNDATGNITFTEIAYTLDQVGSHMYTVKETATVAQAVADKYIVELDETEYTILVNVVNNAATGNLDVTWSISQPVATKLAFTNDFQLRVGNIGVVKVDSKDTTKGLSGAEFTVYTDEACTTVLMLDGEEAIITTGATGAGALDGLPIGTYWVKETKAPQHYLLDEETVYEVTVVEGDRAMVNGIHVTNKKMAKLALEKSDRLNPDKKLPDAEYTLFTEEDCEEEDILVLPDGTEAIITTGEDGVGELEGVPAGTYWVKETKAPTGYEVDPIPYKVIVPEEEDPENPVFVAVSDFPLRGALSLSKTVVASSEVTDTFLFDIELTLETDDPIVGSYKATLNGAETENVTFTATETGAKATVELKDGETMSIIGLRAGVSYTVTEQPNSRYDVTVNGVEATSATGTISDTALSIVKYQNTLKETGFTVEKVWLGEDAGEIKLTLYANGVAMDPQPAVTREGNTYSYADLVMKDENGAEIVYTVKETAMAGYTTSYENAAPNADKTDAAYNGGKIINQAMTTFAVKKEWSGLAEGEKAPAIQLTLYCNGKVYTAATPTPDKDGWYTYADLPAYVDGQLAVYTVKEEPVTGFTTTYINKGENAAVTDCAYNGSTIVNSKIPQTGDKAPLTLWMLTTLLAACGLMGVMATLRKREN